MLLLAGMELDCGRFKVQDFINSGGYGEVYSATDRLTQRGVAIKAERKGSKAVSQLENEAQVLLYLAGERSNHTLAFVRYAETETMRYLVMERCGPNLRDLKKKTPNDRFSIVTSLWLMQKMISALRYLHGHQLIHRDAKPNNFCIGLKEQRRLYLIDYGLCKRADSQHKRHFFGTVRYASLNAHQKKPLTKYDDLWSILYASVENMVGALPWRHLSDREQVQQMKMGTNLLTLCYGDEGPPPVSLVSMHRTLVRMLDEPLAHLYPMDYCDLLGRIEHDLFARRYSSSHPLDWQKPSKKHPRPFKHRGGGAKQHNYAIVL